jgi:hypothetical protein
VRPFIAELALQSVEGTSSEDGLSTGVINAKEDGSFEIHNVLPGSYELVARLPVNVGWGEQSPPGLSVGSLAFGRTSLQVRDSDISNVSVIVHPGMDLVGFVAVDGKPAQAAVRIALQPDDVATRNPVFGAILGQVGAYQPPILADGRFTIPVVPPGHYRLQVFPGETPQPLTEATPCSGQATRKPQTGLTAVHPQTYLADIRQRGISVYDKGLTFGSDPVGPIEVLLNTNAGSIAGIVVGPDRGPIARATVVLVPPMNRRQNPALYKLARSDAEGRFSLDLVPPGSYKLFAWESVQPSAYQNAGFLEKFEDRGVNVTVSPGSRVDVTVDWIADSVSR